jgi:hypothetical protein
MLTVMCYWWTDPEWAKSYGPEDVRLLRRMVQRNLDMAHEFVVVTDQPHCFDGDAGIRALPLDKKVHKPGTAFGKLWHWRADIDRWLYGDRIAVMDLDTVITGDLDPLFSREEELVLWRNPTRKWQPNQHYHQHALDPPEMREKDLQRWIDKTETKLWDPKRRIGKNQARPWYNSSLMFLKPGVDPRMYDSFFDPEIMEGVRDDQWLVSKLAGPYCAYYNGERDGVYRLQRKTDPKWTGRSGTTVAIDSRQSMLSFCATWCGGICLCRIGSFA